VRIVPLITAIAFFAASAFAEDVSVAAGKSPVAIKLQNAGVDYMDNGDYVNARKSFDEALRVDPTMWPAYINRANLNVREHKLKAALEDATMALRGRTSFTQSAILRAEINMKLGNYDDALRELNHVESLGSRGNAYPQALNGLSWFHATCSESRYRNGQLALTEAKKACGLTNYQKPGFLDTLAAAYAETGDFDTAVRFEEKALLIRDSPHNMLEGRKHLNVFKQHRPWRETAMN
jgi:tetratricopeptide (TPR) repeat protein